MASLDVAHAGRVLAISDDWMASLVCLILLVDGDSSGSVVECVGDGQGVRLSDDVCMGVVRLMCELAYRACVCSWEGQKLPRVDGGCT